MGLGDVANGTTFVLSELEGEYLPLNQGPHPENINLSRTKQNGAIWNATDLWESRMMNCVGFAVVRF